MNLISRKAVLVHVLAVICLALTLAGCDNDTDIRHSKRAPSTITGSFDVYYSIQTSETSTMGTGDTPSKATAIHFYDEYIVVEESKSSEILPINKIISFRWTPD
ncbi:hypothetical protein STSP2_00981 [Anaerohalosphaera lusitana]|uniref:Uncharacterized protein n=1 Tax=Anaerohalosphaera lusitana TaxID=1936003 RepID=A0A1U9NJS4_9BACT|nr:hypothetical protein [Anaerohalosphaera lusitana]AQT67830.1 hypothetical protein STSP2_00981 [Anaerohalosphaera lusitana]